MDFHEIRLRAIAVEGGERSIGRNARKMCWIRCGRSHAVFTLKDRSYMSVEPARGHGFLAIVVVVIGIVPQRVAGDRW